MSSFTYVWPLYVTFHYEFTSFSVNNCYRTFQRCHAGAMPSPKYAAAPEETTTLTYGSAEKEEDLEQVRCRRSRRCLLSRRCTWAERPVHWWSFGTGRRSSTMRTDARRQTVRLPSPREWTRPAASSSSRRSRRRSVLRVFPQARDAGLGRSCPDECCPPGKSPAYQQPTDSVTSTVGLPGHRVNKSGRM